MSIFALICWASAIWFGSGLILWLGIVVASRELNWSVDLPMLPCVMFLGPFGWYLYFSDNL